MLYAPSFIFVLLAIIFAIIASLPFAAGLIGLSTRIVIWLIGVAAAGIVIALGSSIFEEASRNHAANARDVLLWWYQTAIGMLLTTTLTALAVLCGYALGVKVRAGLLWLRRRISRPVLNG